MNLWRFRSISLQLFGGTIADIPVSPLIQPRGAAIQKVESANQDFWMETIVSTKMTVGTRVESGLGGRIPMSADRDAIARKYSMARATHDSQKLCLSEFRIIVRAEQRKHNRSECELVQ
jgi:hypothetical protein